MNTNPIWSFLYLLAIVMGLILMAKEKTASEPTSHGSIVWGLMISHFLYYMGNFYSYFGWPQAIMIAWGGFNLVMHDENAKSKFNLMSVIALFGMLYVLFCGHFFDSLLQHLQ